MVRTTVTDIASPEELIFRRREMDKKRYAERVDRIQTKLHSAFWVLGAILTWYFGEVSDLKRTNR